MFRSSLDFLTLLLSLGFMLTRGEPRIQCNDLSLDSCKIYEVDILAKQETYDERSCQMLCKNNEADNSCFVFQYNRITRMCTLVTEDYRKECKVVALPDDARYEDCFEDHGPHCDTFIDEECEYLGDIVFQNQTDSPSSCKWLCNMHSKANCVYWKYDQTESYCTLYDSNSKNCSVISGAMFPDIDTYPESTTTFVSHECQVDWNSDGDLGCFYFNADMDKFNLTWVEAQNECEELDAYLAEAKSPEEHSFLRSEAILIEKFDEKINWWIGLTDTGHEQKWLWSHSVEEPLFQSWVDSRPNKAEHNIDDCVIMDSSEENDYNWFDVDCTTKVPLNHQTSFICQQPFKDAPTTTTEASTESTEFTSSSTSAATETSPEKSTTDVSTTTRTSKSTTHTSPLTTTSTNAIGDCESFTASKCSHPEDTKVHKDIFGADELTCQSLCAIFLGCEYYRYESSINEPENSTCSFFTEDFRDTCIKFGSDKDSNIDSCINLQPFSSSCDEFLKEDCNYDLNLVIEFEIGDIDLSECRERCSLKDGCRYWTFESEQTTVNGSTPTRCSLFKDDKSIISSCKAVHGPKQPNHEECGPY